MKENTENKPSLEHDILTAAEELFIRKGFDSTTIKEIAQAAGCNQALVHYYYRTKSLLFEKFFAKKLKDEFLGLLFTIEMTNDSIFTLIENVVDAHFEMARSNVDMILFVINEFYKNKNFKEHLKAAFEEHLNVIQPRLAFLQSMLDQHAAAQEIRETRVGDLLFSMASLNIFTVISAEPMAYILSNELGEQFLMERKKEIKRIILESIKL